MTGREIVRLGRRIARATERDLPALAADFVRALAVDVDGRKAPALIAPPAAEVAEVRHLISIATDYFSEEPIAHEAPRTGKVIDHLRARLDARARREDGFNVFVELVGQHVENGLVKFMKQGAIHKQWAEMRRLHRRTVLVTSVDSGKTSQTILWLVWLIARNHNLRVCLLAATSARAVDLLRSAAELILSDNVKRIFPDLKPADGGPWSTTQLTVQRSAIGLKEATISAFGVDGAVQSLRADVIAADDLVNKTNSATTALIEDLNSFWTSTVETRLSGDDGIVVYTGTPWKPGDLVQKLRESSLYHSAVFPLIDTEGRVSWPEHWSAKRVEEKRIALGPVDFARFCLCSPRTDEGAAFAEKDVTAASTAGVDFPAANSLEDLPEGFPEGTTIYVACDPASGSLKKRRDNTAIATVAVLPDNTHVLLYLYSGRAGFAEARKIMREQFDRWAPKVIAIESGGMQSTWAGELRAEGLPIYEHVTSSANKFDGSIGVESMAVLFANGKVVFPKHVIDTLAGRALVNGLLFFDRGKHTADELMSFWIAYHAAKRDRRAVRPADVPTVNVRIIGGERDDTRPAPEPESVYTTVDQNGRTIESKSSLRNLFPDGVNEIGPRPEPARPRTPQPEREPSEEDLRERERERRRAGGLPARGSSITVWKP